MIATLITRDAPAEERTRKDIDESYHRRDVINHKSKEWLMYRRQCVAVWSNRLAITLRGAIQDRLFFAPRRAAHDWSYYVIILRGSLSENQEARATESVGEVKADRRRWRDQKSLAPSSPFRPTKVKILYLTPFLGAIIEHALSYNQIVILHFSHGDKKTVYFISRLAFSVSFYVRKVDFSRT